MHSNNFNNFNNFNSFNFGNFLKKHSDENLPETEKYKLVDIDNPNGWNFNEIDILGDIGFKIDNEYDMISEIVIPNLEMSEEKKVVKVYKSEEGYVLEINRRYIFETFDKMIEFIDSKSSSDTLK